MCTIGKHNKKNFTIFINFSSLWTWYSSVLQELEYCQAVVLSVVDEVGVRAIMDQLMEVTRSEDVGIRRAAATLLCGFCSHTRADYSQYVPQLLRGLIHLFTDQDREVLQISWEALGAVTKVQVDFNSDLT